jgi:hypothetical protein
MTQQLDRRIVEILDPAWKGEPDAAIVQTIESRLLEAPSAIERATKLAAWKKLWEVRNPNRRNGGDRKSAKYAAEKSESNNWTLIAAERLKLARSTIFADVQLAEKLGRADIERLWASPIANDGHALRQFAALQPPQRDTVYRRMCAEPKKSWEDWLRALRLKPETDGEDAVVERLYSAFKAATAREQRRFLARIGLTSSEADRVIARLRGDP